LLLWDISPEDIARLERTGEVKRTLDLHADRSGYVVQKTAFHGMRVTPMDALFDIADLSHLWILADVYEHDLPAVRLGMNAEVSVPYQPGKTWKGPVTNIAPTVDEKTRTIKVRIEVDNRGDALKPDMFADVFLRVDLGSGLALNESAVIDAGDRRLVFLDRSQGRYEPREVTLGVKAGRFFQVLSGLEEGDLVVTSANFLLDSESSLRAALTAMKPAPGQP
jgi:Cu(I)/Ag(I) efflux system membrane fusion protein